MPARNGCAAGAGRRARHSPDGHRSDGGIYLNYMNKSKLALSILAILLGVFMFVYAGIDDSPGGQLLGVIVGIIGIVGVIKSKKKT